VVLSVSRRKTRLPKDPIKTIISAISHDGRGISHVDDKTVFISNALPDEEVLFQYKSKRSKIAEGQAIEIFNPSPHRVKPSCEYFTICGGCSLQHIDHTEQLTIKQNALIELLKAKIETQSINILEPIVSDIWGYRRKARLGVRYVHKKEKVLVGFREKYSNFLTDMDSCEVLHPSIGKKLSEFADLIRSLSIYRDIPQFEIAVGEDATALIIRYLKNFLDEDLEILKNFAQKYDFHIYLQSGGPATIEKFYPENKIERLHYELKKYKIKLAFHPSDFTQVNFDINNQMVDRALTLLELNENDTVLDLFCGLGNFTLPMARMAKHVTGVEGSQAMIERGYENAKANDINNAEFYAADLSKEISQYDWAKRQYDKVLLDPPRSGAQEVLASFKVWKPDCIVYVSCNPATFARDAAILVDMGYTLDAAGIMDMFPHTSHVESIAVFKYDIVH